MKKIIILIPVFNDWESLAKLINEINENIKDYKNIQYYLVKEQYFLKQLPLISKSTKYSNLFLNGGYGSISCNLSFGAAHSILQKETSKN